MKKKDVDEYFIYDEDEQEKIRDDAPWKRDPHYFKKVKISDIALVKMVMHAVSGGEIEVMGLMQGKIEANTFVITDSFALPVQATETRVNAGVEGTEYMIGYIDKCLATGKNEGSVGWYHSHPGYGCWLSGIDVATQRLNQTGQDPWLAMVVDPVVTMAQQQVEIGAFRVFPEGYKPKNESESGPGNNIPVEKMKDFGIHANEYYKLEVETFNSTMNTKLLRLLWNKYWVNTLASNSNSATKNYTSKCLSELNKKMEVAESDLQSSRYRGFQSKKEKETKIKGVSDDSSKLAIDQIRGTMNQVLKNYLFNGEFRN